MKFSIPFLGTNIAQLPPKGLYPNQSVEAVIFNRKDLEEDSWELVWKNIQKAVDVYGNKNVTFHFPVNDSEYCNDLYVQKKVLEGLERATFLKLQGMVVHSNQIALLPWLDVDMDAKRKEVIETLSTIRDRVKGDTFLALENMPVMDNYAVEIDPLFVFPSNFHGLKSTNVKVVWDFCHYTNSLANIQEVFTGKQNPKYYPNIQQTDYLDFVQIKDLIYHWHFSAFLGIANPDTEQRCVEGIAPNESQLGPEVYSEILKKLKEIHSDDHHMVFEIKEDDYTNRINTKRTIEWTKSYI